MQDMKMLHNRMELGVPGRLGNVHESYLSKHCDDHHLLAVHTSWNDTLRFVH